jgi:hypothetical protein
MTQIVIADIPEKERLLKNFFNVIRVYGAVWIIFHLISVFFFGFIVGSPLLVGIFLGIWNIWAMLIDVPLGTIQRQASSKTMLSIANGMMLLAAIVFLYLTYSSVDEGFKLSGGILEITKSFFSTGINLILLVSVGILYGTVKEIYDIVTLSYLLNHADPSDFDKVLSKNNIAFGVWSVAGVLISIPLLWFQSQSVQFILFLLIFLIVLSWIFIQYYFDNSHEVFSVNTVKNLHLVEEVKSLEVTGKTYVKTTMSTLDFEQAKKWIQYLVLKPKQISEQFDWGDIAQKTKTEYRMIYRLVFSKVSFVPILLWTTGSILLFGCWDNVATTFFVKFLDEAMQNVDWVKNIIQSGFILIGILAIPAYVLQGFWIKQAEKFGKFRIITLWLFFSGGALFLLALFGRMDNLLWLVLVVCMWLLNSTGYAAGYPMSQSIFADEYNRSFAKENNTTVINADAAAPLKILNNFANAVGLIFWGALITFFGFTWMFIIYGLILIVWAGLSIKNRILWKLG